MGFRLSMLSVFASLAKFDDFYTTERLAKSHSGVIIPKSTGV